MGAAGRLKVFLGAAPGVGKSYAMFREGHRLAAEGRDVVVALAETHARAETERLLDGLAIIERTAIEHRGVTLSEMDTDAVLARRPDVALVDELAHSNPAGSPNAKRYQDVQRLLEAGIDVLSTVNIQHVASLNDVIEKITGVSQRETLPDAVLRAADEIEVMDLAPQALRSRLAEGSVYPAERIDAAMSNYFRVGNLTALRELTLLWMADEVDHSLLDYRRQHGIDSSWQARENVLVSLSGGLEGQALIRRGARIAARSAGGTLIVVHVSTQDGLRRSDPQELGAQRLLAESLGGSYHQVVGRTSPRRCWSSPGRSMPARWSSASRDAADCRRCSPARAWARVSSARPGTLTCTSSATPRPMDIGCCHDPARRCRHAAGCWDSRLLWPEGRC
ncbi:hypothetical protein GCM10010525_18560 [Glutamicibacter bergerei]